MIDEVNLRLPKTEKAVERFYRNCEKRNKFVKDSEDHYKKRLEKAKHDLKCAMDEIESGGYDWTIVKAYYAIHHAANALFSKKLGIFSKDHSCLIVSLKYKNLISTDFFNKLMDIYEGFNDTLSIGLTFELRKIG